MLRLVFFAAMKCSRLLIAVPRYARQLTNDRRGCLNLPEPECCYLPVGSECGGNPSWCNTLGGMLLRHVASLWPAQTCTRTYALRI